MFIFRYFFKIRSIVAVKTQRKQEKEGVRQEEMEKWKSIFFLNMQPETEPEFSLFMLAVLSSGYINLYYLYHWWTENEKFQLELCDYYHWILFGQ